MSDLLSLPFFYLLGAFPTGRIIGKLRGVDLTTRGSGNVGATNVARTIGKKAGAVTLLIDILKGFLAPAAAYAVPAFAISPILAGFTAVCGHCFSVPGISKGGKGVACGFGVFLAISPIAALVALAAFAAAFRGSGIVSLSSLTAAWSLPPVAWITGEDLSTVYLGTAIALLITFRHKDNIRRLRRKEEPKISITRHLKHNKRKTENRKRETDSVPES